MTTPLHTNKTKKIVFVFSFAASTFFSVLLFQSIGSNIPLKLVWSLVAIATVFFQTVKLREYYNTKKQIRYLHFTFYIICTIASIAGTIGAGYSQIEKLKPTVSKIELDNREKLINKILTHNTNINQWAGLAYTKQLDKIEVKKEIIKSNDNSMINSLSGIAGIFGISEQKTAFVFLVFVSAILEMMIFGSATFNGELFKKRAKKSKKVKLSKLEKEKNAGQVFFKMRKVG